MPGKGPGRQKGAIDRIHSALAAASRSKPDVCAGATVYRHVPRRDFQREPPRKASFKSANIDQLERTVRRKMLQRSELSFVSIILTPRSEKLVWI